MENMDDLMLFLAGLFPQAPVDTRSMIGVGPGASGHLVLPSSYRMPPMQTMCVTILTYQHAIDYDGEQVSIGKRPHRLTDDFLAKERIPQINMPPITALHIQSGGELPPWLLPDDLHPQTKGFIVQRLFAPMPHSLPLRSPVLVDIAYVTLEELTYEYWQSLTNGFLLLVARQNAKTIRGQYIRLISVYKKPIKNFSFRPLSKLGPQ